MTEKPIQGPTLLDPFCVSRPEDPEVLAPIHAIFDDPVARELGLVAIAQHYYIARGDANPDDSLVFLVHDPSTGEISTLRHGRRSGGSEISYVDAHHLSVLWDTAHQHEPLNSDMLYITSAGLWLLAFPRVLVMQADDVERELRAAAQIRADLTGSTWARTAYATLRVAPPASAHEAMANLEASREALKVLRKFRPGEFVKGRAFGYDLGEVTPEILGAAANFVA